MRGGQAEPTPGQRARRRVLGALSVSLLAVAVAYGIALYLLRPAASGVELTFDDITRYATCNAGTGIGAGSAVQPSTPYCQNVKGRIATATFLDLDSRIVGTVVDQDGGSPRDFWASYPHSDAATADLLRSLSAGRTKVVVDAQSGKELVHFVAQFVLPLVLLANLFALLFYFVQRSASGVAEFARFGKAGGKEVAKEHRAITRFRDVAAAAEALAELAEVRDYLINRAEFRAMGASPPKGVLLVGPPGCGKTLLARAVAGEADAAFFAMSGSEFVESLVGIGAARVRDLFAQARASAPAIIFIDELDAVGRQRGTGLGQGHDEREQTLNELLVQMDGFSSGHGLVVLAATNRPDILDPALLRAGRFDRHVTVERPDLEGRLEILRLHAQGRRLLDPDADLPVVAASSAGFSGADLANLLNEAALLAVREGAPGITQEHLAEAVDRVVSGPRRKATLLTPEDRRAVAYHEAGHAVVATALGQAARIHKISIIARGRGLGHLALLSVDRSILRRSDLEGQIAIAMAGPAVEEMVFDEASTGCEQDVERATHAARDLAGKYGLSPRIGRVRVLARDHEVFLGRDYLAARDVSQPTLEELDSEVRRIVEEQHALALSILIAHRPQLDDIARELSGRETLQGAELERLLGAVHPAPSVAAG